MIKTIFLTLSISLLFTSAIFAQTSTAAETVSAPTAKPQRAPIFRPTKDQIIQVQIKLKGKQLYSGDASGKYNDETRSGIKSFQKDNGLKQTGTLNRATLEKFGVDLTDSQKLIPVSARSLASDDDEKSTSEAKSKTGTGKRAPIFRATADQIRSAQKMLKTKAMYSGDETGKLDTATRDGLKKFQDDNGVKVTGTLNALTLLKMGIPLTDKQKADAAEWAKKSN